MKKQLKIFFLVAFLLPYTLGILMGFGFYQGLNVGVFPNAQMYYPAAGAMLALLLTADGEKPLPKKFFIGFITLSTLMALSAAGSVLLPALPWAGILNTLIIVGSLILLVLLLFEKKPVREAFYLRMHTPKTSLLLVALFFVMLLVRVFAAAALESDAASFFEALISPNFWLMLFAVLLNFVFTFSAFFGEEYGWRTFLQPRLQSHFGKKKGVLVLGLLWGIWHLPINIFFYSPDTWVLSVIGQLITCVSLAIFFGWAYEKTKNIWVPTMMHFLNNNLLVLFGGTADSIQNQTMTWETIIFLLVINAVLFVPFLFTKEFRENLPE